MAGEVRFRNPSVPKPHLDAVPLPVSPGRHPLIERDSVPSTHISLASLAMSTECKHNASMPNVLIRDLPADVHASLQRRAEAAGQSLQQYLTAELSRVAQAPTMSEVLERIAERSGGRVGLAAAADDLHDERSRR